MKISGRNQLQGKVKAIEVDHMLAKVVVELTQGQQVTGLITADAAVDLGLSVGDDVSSLIKSTSIMFMK